MGQQDICSQNQYALRIEGPSWLDDLTIEQMWAVLKAAYQQLRDDQDLLFIALLRSGEMPAEIDVRPMPGQSGRPRPSPDKQRHAGTRTYAPGVARRQSHACRGRSKLLMSRQVAPLPDRKTGQRHTAYPYPAQAQRFHAGLLA